MRRGVSPRTPRLACFCILALVLSACASPRITLPRGSGTPLTDYEDLFAAAVDPCRRVRTLELLLAISGRTGDARLRGRVRGALARPGSLRLEGLAPFGAPAFVLVAGSAPPVLLLPRERRVVTGASGRDLLAALAGLPLGPADFRALLTGCLVPQPRAVAARTFGGGWVGVALEGDATLYLREVGPAPVMVAGRRPGLIVEYAGHVRGLPRRIRVQTTAPDAAATDLTATLSQVDINVELDERAFVQEVPGGFVPVPIEMLRGAPGPLEERRPPEAAGLPPRPARRPVTCTVRAPAKINLHLRILGRRPDRFHEVCTLLQSVGLHDTLAFRRRPGPLTVRSRSSGMPRDRANLVWAAASALWTANGRSGDPTGAAVTITKRIPAAAGLGGGSSDAAAALRGLCAVWGIAASDRWLRAVAARVGSDVPYFLAGGAALARGRGERVRGVPDIEPLWVVLSCPPFGVSTADAYRWFDAAAGPGAAGPAALPRGWRRGLRGLANDLEPIVVERHPEVGRMIERLRRTGALRAAMTGSGSAVFGLYATQAAAHAARLAARRRGWRAVVSRTTERAEFRRGTAVRPGR